MFKANEVTEGYRIGLVHGLPDGLAGYLALALCTPAAVSKVLDMGLELVEIRAVLDDRPHRSPEEVAKSFDDAAEIHGLSKCFAKYELPEYVLDPVAAVTARRALSEYRIGIINARAAHSDATPINTARRTDGRRELSGMNAQAADYWANQKEKQ